MTIYQVRMNRQLKNIKVYIILKKIGQRDSFMTKLFMRIFNQQDKRKEQQSAYERLR